MNTELLGVIATFAITVAIAIPFGKYISKVFKGEKTLLDFFAPLEKLIFKICGIDSSKQMNWKQHLIALLAINMLWFVYALFCIISIPMWSYCFGWIFVPFRTWLNHFPVLGKRVF